MAVEAKAETAIHDAGQTMIQIRTLNLQHGGGKRAGALGEYLLTDASEIVVLSEFRDNPSGRLIRDRLAQSGYKFESSNPPPGMNGVAVASKLAFTTLAHPSDGLFGQECRWLECAFSEFRLVATYFPGGEPKLEYWRWFMPHAHSRVETSCIFVGDFNTGKHRIDEIGATFFGPEYMTKMESDGWVDAWRQLNADGREYTWSSHAGGEFRLDYVWLSRPIAGWLHRAGHDHRPRSSGITDHSALYVELNLPSNNA